MRECETHVYLMRIDEIDCCDGATFGTGTIGQLWTGTLLQL